MSSTLVNDDRDDDHDDQRTLVEAISSVSIVDSNSKAYKMIEQLIQINYDYGQPADNCTRATRKELLVELVGEFQELSTMRYTSKTRIITRNSKILVLIGI